MMSETAPTLWQRLWYTRLRDAVRGRFDASLDWRRVVAEADIPPTMADTISSVVGRTRLWQREKVDVAHELIAHFQDGLDAGRTADQLVDSFGNPILAAKLIRRAKRRCRPLVWHVLRWCLIGYVGFSLVYVMIGLYILSGRPSITTDYFAIVNERANSVPEAERAWPLYREALQQMRVDRRLPNWADSYKLSPSDPEWREATRWLDSHAADMQFVRDGAGRRDLGFAVDASQRRFLLLDRQVLDIELDAGQQEPLAQDPVADRMLVGAHLPHLPAMRSLAKLLSIDARRAAMHGDGKTALADVNALFGLSRQTTELPFLVNTLVAIEIERIACATIEEISRRQPQLWTDAQLLDLAHTVAASKVDWKWGFTGERAIVADILQRIYTDDGHGDGRPVFYGFGIFKMMDSLIPVEMRQTYPPPSQFWSTEVGSLLAAPAATFVVASRKEMNELYDRFLDATIRRIDTPLWQSGNDPMAELNATYDGALFGNWRYFVIPFVASAFEDIRLTIATENGQRDGVLVGIALELYHRQHGDWPRALTELSPHWLPNVPLDRVTGQPLGYKIVDDRPIVYSVGADLDDDGGRMPIDNLGGPIAYLSAPTKMDGAPLDGDWVIWSTSEVK